MKFAQFHLNLFAKWFAATFNWWLGVIDFGPLTSRMQVCGVVGGRIWGQRMPVADGGDFREGSGALSVL